MSVCPKHTYRSEEEKKQILNRLRRIEGQVKGVQKMVDNDCYCNDILIQLSAIENSLKSLSHHILQNHLYTCISNEFQDNHEEVIEELISLFKRFNK